jgi:hypothetical protein
VVYSQIFVAPRALIDGSFKVKTEEEKQATRDRAKLRKAAQKEERRVAREARKRERLAQREEERLKKRQMKQQKKKKTNP